MNLAITQNQKNQKYQSTFKASADVPASSLSMEAQLRNVSNLKQPEAPTKVKMGVLLCNALGIATGLAIAYKRGKFIKPEFRFKGEFGKNPLGKIDYDPWNVLTLATCSIGGGLIGGAIFDKKENMKAKLREGLIQMLGNIIVPIICVGGGTKLYDKFLKEKVLKTFKFTEKTKGIPSLLVTAITLATAIFAGFKTGNFINEDIYHIRDDRKFKFADMSGHLDDTCMAISLSNESSMLSRVASRVIPLALVVCGYSTGTMQEWPPEIRELRKVDKSSKAKHTNNVKPNNNLKN